MLRRTLLTAVALLMGATAIRAQEPATAPPRYTASLSVGGFGGDTFQQQPVVAERLTGQGEALDSAGLSRTVEADGGVQLLLGGTAAIGRLWSVRATAGYAVTTLRARYAGPAELWATAAGHLAATERTDATVLSLEGAVRRWIPSPTQIEPYVEMGAAMLRFSAEEELPGAADLGGGVGRLAAVAAAGGEVPISGSIRGHIQATARVFRTPVDPAPIGAAGARSSTLAVYFDQPGATAFADEAHELLTTVRLQAGVTVAFGRTPAVEIQDPQIETEGAAAREPTEPRGSGGTSSSLDQAPHRLRTPDR